MATQVLEGVEPIIKLLSALIIFFTVVLIFCEHFFPADGQVFQVFCGVLTGLVGALMIRVKPPHSEGDDKSTTVVGKIVESSRPISQPTDGGKVI